MDEAIFERSGKWFYRDDDGEQSKPFDTRAEAKAAFERYEIARKGQSKDEDADE